MYLCKKLRSNEKIPFIALTGLLIVSSTSCVTKKNSLSLKMEESKLSPEATIYKDN